MSAFPLVLGRGSSGSHCPTVQPPQLSYLLTLAKDIELTETWVTWCDGEKKRKKREKEKREKKKNDRKEKREKERKEEGKRKKVRHSNGIKGVTLPLLL